MIIDYTNHRGERGLRNITPIRFYMGETQYHPGTQWLMLAHDEDKNAERTFAMKTVHAWDLPAGSARPVPETKVIQVTFPVPVNLPLGFERQLDALVDTVCQEWMRDNPSQVMWPAGAGNAPQWNEPHEPTFDSSIYQIDVAAREDTGGSNPWNPERDRIRTEMRAEHKRRVGERKAAGHV